MMKVTDATENNKKPTDPIYLSQMIILSLQVELLLNISYRISVQAQDFVGWPSLDSGPALLHLISCRWSHI